MWARVKAGRKMNLLATAFKAACMSVRSHPGLDGIVSKTPVYRVLYVVFGPVFTLLGWISPASSPHPADRRAMILVAKRGAPKPILESSDITRWGRIRRR